MDDLIEANGLFFLINQDDLTADIVGFQNMEELFIPRSIQYNTEEYIITSVNNLLDHPLTDLQSVSFSNDSKVRKILDIFSRTNIKSISIPASVEEFDDNWSKSASYLTNITISPNNTNFIYYNDQVILGKSDKTQKNYDVLIFVRRDVEIFKVPSFIKYIKPYSFYDCKKLKNIIFTEDSELFSIGKEAFAFTKIQDFYFPANLTNLEKGWCCNTKELTNIFISPKNKNFKFFDAKHQIIIGKTKSDTEIFDCIVFANRDIKEVFIPSNIKIIERAAFSDCKQIEFFEFSKDSELVSIEDESFFKSSINQIIIPKHVKKIGKYAFSDCLNLYLIEFEQISELSIIEYSAFSNSGIKKILIPSNVEEIGKYAFSHCSNLECFEFQENSKLSLINENTFSFSEIKEIIIPKNVKEIKDYAFTFCSNLSFIDFEDNSELNSLGTYLFCNSQIEIITIPSKIKEIKNFPFTEMNDILMIDFKEDSEFTTFGDNALRSSFVETLKFPPKLRYFGENWCNDACEISNILISPENQYLTYLDTKHQMVIGRSDIESDFYDTFILVTRKVKYVFIPFYIRIISSCAFADCHHLKKVEFEENSNLEIICENAFSDIAIKNITIPHNVSYVKKEAFSFCSNLNCVECLSEIVTLEKSFMNCGGLLISFPNSREINFIDNNKNICIFTQPYTKIMFTLAEKD